MVKLLP